MVRKNYRSVGLVDTKLIKISRAQNSSSSKLIEISMKIEHHRSTMAQRSEGVGLGTKRLRGRRTMLKTLHTSANSFGRDVGCLHLCFLLFSALLHSQAIVYLGGYS